MAEYLEELDNELGQVFAEFATFLYYDSTLKNVLKTIDKDVLQITTDDLRL